ncbi:flavin reductase [Rhizobiales bacterium GAS191]|jgi:flavin reductase (DIM6/NTAB) family NADH-FMN oxidoreductase RutF|nr:flavin reductase [Rhizobiales bacterium GAS191]
MHAHVDPVRFREAMRLTASGVTVVTSDGPSGPAGLTASTFQSLSMDLPSVMVCIHVESRNLSAILKNRVFVANVLAVDQEKIASRFAQSLQGRPDDRFAHEQWRAIVTGAPALYGALCNFDCTVTNVFTHASHKIVVGEVLAVEVSGAEPLIYSNRAYRALKAAIDQPHSA